MTHTEQILVYSYTKADDGWGGTVLAAPQRELSAPTWATIKEVRGDDLTMSERVTTATQYDIFANWREDFDWKRTMFIVSDHYGVIDIDGIHEQQRKRLMKIRGVYVDGVDDTGNGTPSPIDGLMTLYYTMGSDAATVSLPAISGKVVYLVFLDGVEKKVVSSNPQPNEVAVNGGVLSLTEGDIFSAGQRITILYR